MCSSPFIMKFATLTLVLLVSVTLAKPYHGRNTPRGIFGNLKPVCIKDGVRMIDNIIDLVKTSVAPSLVTLNNSITKSLASNDEGDVLIEVLIAAHDDLDYMTGKVISTFTSTRLTIMRAYIAGLRGERICDKLTYEDLGKLNRNNKAVMCLVSNIEKCISAMSKVAADIAMKGERMHEYDCVAVLHAANTTDVSILLHAMVIDVKCLLGRLHYLIMELNKFKVALYTVDVKHADRIRNILIRVMLTVGGIINEHHVSIATFCEVAPMLAAGESNLSLEESHQSSVLLGNSIENSGSSLYESIPLSNDVDIRKIAGKQKRNGKVGNGDKARNPSVLSVSNSHGIGRRDRHYKIHYRSGLQNSSSISTSNESISNESNVGLDSSSSSDISEISGISKSSFGVESSMENSVIDSKMISSTLYNSSFTTNKHITHTHGLSISDDLSVYTNSTPIHANQSSSSSSSSSSSLLASSSSNASSSASSISASAPSASASSSESSSSSSFSALSASESALSSESASSSEASSASSSSSASAHSSESASSISASSSESSFASSSALSANASAFSSDSSSVSAAPSSSATSSPPPSSLPTDLPTVVNIEYTTKALMSGNASYLSAFGNIINKAETLNPVDQDEAELYNYIRELIEQE